MTKLALIDRQPAKNGEPVFDEPWQARVFAMAVYLNQTGAFTWKEWADRFSNHIAEFEIGNKIKNSNDYYTLWTKTLENYAQELKER